MVHHGMITDRVDQRVTHWRDRAGLEEQLIDQAYSRGYGDVLEKRGVSRARSQP